MHDDGYFRIGDVVVDRNNEHRVITGYKTEGFGWLNAYRNPPGVYADKSYVAVRTLEGLQRPGFYSHALLSHATQEVASTRSALEKRRVEKVRVSDLPNPKFWEGDLVRCGPNELYVNAVDYAQLVFDTVEKSQPVYVLGAPLNPVRIFRSDDNANVLIAVDGMRRSENQLRLLQRGNVWKHHHDDPLKFNTIRDELLFHIMMGWFEPVVEKIYSEAEAARYVARGTADGYFVAGNSPMTDRFHVVRLTKASTEISMLFQGICREAPENRVTIRLP